jgi:mannose-6-phosphate isomerase-like protein (cupin superfamily)
MVEIMEPSRYPECEPYQTKDGSEIRELMHPAVQGNRAQSLAEARVEPGGHTLAHRHRQTEELYHVLEGHGRLYRDGEAADLSPGDTACIAPGTVHWIENTGTGTLRFLCCCSPAYRHEDTELVP